MRKIFTISQMAFLSLLFLISCEQKEEKIIKDYNFRYVNLSGREIDSIYDSHRNDLVFLSFYPGMHDDIYRKYLRIEQEKRNLRGETFELDSSKTKNILYSSPNAFSLKISIQDYWVNLISTVGLRNSQYQMAMNLYQEKYGKPKDTVLGGREYVLFEESNRIITFETDLNSLLTIKYWTQNSLNSFIEAYLNKLEERERFLEELENSKSKKEKILEKI